jgi:hypothetical protein
MGFGRQFSIVYWDEIKYKIKTINQELFYLIDEINPGNEFPLYLFSFAYGDLIGDSETFYIPHNGNLLTLNNFSSSDAITKDLFYGFHSCPLGMVLDKCFEWYIHGTRQNETHPIYIDKPGDFFNISHITQIKPLKNYLPNGILSVKTGIQTICAIQNIGCQRSFKRLQRFGVKSNIPKSYNDHSELFRNIYENNFSLNKWNGSIIYFSKPWIDQILKNPDWVNINKYFFKYYLRNNAYSHCGDYYQHIFRVAFDKSNVERDLFIQDAAKYIFEVLIGEKYGFSFADSDDFAPISSISEILKEVYGFKTTPSILIPQKHIENKPIYFSLQHPIFRTYQGLSRKKVTLLSELENIFIVCNRYTELFSSKQPEWADTVLEEKSKKARFSFYHGFEDKKNWLSNLNHFIENDPVINKVGIDNFYCDAPFFKGCIAINR